MQKMSQRVVHKSSCAMYRMSLMRSLWRSPRPCRQYSVSIKQLLERPEEAMDREVDVKAWIRSYRKGKAMSFLVVNDGSTHENLQVVIPSNLGSKEDFAFGSSLKVRGSLVSSIKGQQAYELKSSNLEVLGQSNHEYPLQKKYTSAEHLRAHAHLRPRTQFNSALLRAQSEMLNALSAFFHLADFVQTLPPVITSSDCEGAGEVFEIAKSAQFFGKKTYLTVSSQLHLEALAMGLRRVWTLTPTFRAERSTTARHLAEFRMIEAELCFTQSLDEVMDVVEHLIKFLAARIRGSKDLQFIHTLDAENIEQAIDLPARWSSIIDQTWTRITYAEAIQTLLQNKTTAQFTQEPVSGTSLAAEHEKWLAQHYGGPVFVTQYPTHQKPFYMLPSETTENTVECFDLLVPGMGELCGGSLRIHRLPDLMTRMAETGMNVNELDWYLDLRRYGTVSHGGFGIGWERLVGYLAGVSNVREVAAFPRWVNHCVA